jgi:phosphoglycolate phosphatase
MPPARSGSGWRDCPVVVRLPGRSEEGADDNRSVATSLGVRQGSGRENRLRGGLSQASVTLGDVDGRPKASLLVTDLDNTLYDWFEIWFGSFEPMLREIVRISGIPEHQLLQEIRSVHQLRGTSEYSALLQELPSLGGLHPGRMPPDVYASAIEAFREGRKRTMRLYPGVLDTLTTVRQTGVRVVAYTESLAFYTSLRLRWFELDGVIDTVYSPADHEFPVGLTAEDIRKRPNGRYKLQVTDARHTPPGLLKPEPDVLATIVKESAVDPSHVVYVGDSLMKDVAMAQAVGVLDVWAKYGVAQDREGYDLLRSVSHWTQADVERELAIAKQPHVTPSFALDAGFAELLDLFDFVGPDV